MTPPSRSLRQRLRAARRALDPADQRAASAAVAAHLAPLVAMAPGVVAAYVAADGEVDLAPVIADLRSQGSDIVLPRLAADAPAMTFHRVADDAQLVAGDWGLTEPPATAPVVDPRRIDVVLTPLVGFDQACNRIGRGRGYYDRHFAFLAGAPRPARPWLVGVAHEFQLVEDLPVGPHDIALDAVVTPTGVRGRVPW